MKEILDKVKQLKQEGLKPIKIQLHPNYYIKILLECNFIIEEEESYIWFKPGPVETKGNVQFISNIPFIIDGDGPEWAIISEEVV